MISGREVRIGLGLYQTRSEPTPLVERYIEEGGRYVDSAPNYLSGAADFALSEALKKGLTFDFGAKVGFLKSEEERTRFFSAYSDVEHLKRRKYILCPALIRYQVDITLSTLGLSSIPLLFLHNPERLKEYESPDGFEKTLEEIIEAVEGECALGRVSQWGVSTWNGFNCERQCPSFTVLKIEQMARKICGGESHFSAIQLPLGIGHSECVYEDTVNQRGPLVEARALNKEIYASSPFNGGCVIPVINTAFLRLFPGNPSPAQACLQFCSSISGINTIIVGAQTHAQLREAAESLLLPRLSHKQMCEILTLLHES